MTQTMKCTVAVFNSRTNRCLRRMRVSPKAATALAVRFMRTHARFSQRKLAGRMGVSQARISNMERGRHVTQPETLRKVAGACGFDFKHTTTTRSLKKK